jgi:hypothetical protein
MWLDLRLTNNQAFSTRSASFTDMDIEMLISMFQNVQRAINGTVKTDLKPLKSQNRL